MVFPTHPKTREEFLRAVEQHCAGLIVSASCPGGECEYADGDPDHQCKPHFSHIECNSCGSPQTGDRHTVTASAIVKGDDGEILESTDMRMYVCTDCLVYHEYGTTPEYADEHSALSIRDVDTSLRAATAQCELATHNLSRVDAPYHLSRTRAAIGVAIQQLNRADRWVIDAQTHARLWRATL